MWVQFKSNSDPRQIVKGGMNSKVLIGINDAPCRLCTSVCLSVSLSELFTSHQAIDGHHLYTQLAYT